MATVIASSSRAGRAFAGARDVIVEIGGLPILLRTANPDFAAVLEQRYAGFVNPAAQPTYEFEIDLVLPYAPSEEELSVQKVGSTWRVERGDFLAEWDARTRCGRVRQSANPYSIDSVLRIVQSLALAEEGGFLVHAASGVRRGRAFVFAGISGAGKTTIARLAPGDAVVLTDEISCVRRSGKGYEACGTPFAGELARVGANANAPLAGVYLLEKGEAGRIEPVERNEATRALLRHILFFAYDSDLVKRVFEAAVEFVSRVPVARLHFTPDARAWDLIG